MGVFFFTKEKKKLVWIHTSISHPVQTGCASHFSTTEMEFWGLLSYLSVAITGFCTNFSWVFCSWSPFAVWQNCLQWTNMLCTVQTFYILWLYMMRLLSLIPWKNPQTYPICSCLVRLKLFIKSYLASSWDAFSVFTYTSVTSLKIPVFIDWIKATQFINSTTVVVKSLSTLVKKMYIIVVFTSATLIFVWWNEWNTNYFWPPL